MSFKPGQQVIILNLYNLRLDGSGKIVRLINEGENKGRYLIELSCGYGCFEPERIIDAEDYWRTKKNGKDH